VKAILTYHSIDDSRSVISIDPSVFHEHVRWLASGRVRVVSVAELVELPPGEDAVALTFDDGFRNFGTIAAPVLLEHGLPCTLFIVADAVGSTNQWTHGPDPGIPVLPLLGWDDLGRLMEQGIQLGGHTRTHPSLPDCPEPRLTAEVAGGQDRIRDELGIMVEGFAYPYGDWDDRALAVAERRYRWACTTELRPLAVDERLHRLPRIDMFYLRGSGRLEEWGSTRFRLRLGLRAGARAIRARLSGTKRGR
jgi:peptidoglycan/xylan/chitin deacetylase (PgdA/CDA1 family)